jgi:hypothetical protein
VKDEGRFHAAIAQECSVGELRQILAVLGHVCLQW